MLSFIIIVGGAVYAAVSALREDTVGTKPSVAPGNALALANTSTTYRTVDRAKADHYVHVATGALAVSALTFAFPPAGLLAAGLLTYLTIPLYKAATLGLVVDRKPQSSMVGAVVSLASLTSGYYLLSAGCSLAFYYSYRLMLSTQAGTRQQVSHLLGQTPQKVWLAYNEVEVEVPFESLNAGDVIVLQAGELVPIDGTVVQGMATLDQRTLTGESQAIEKGPGERVLASTTVLAGKLHVRVEKAADQTNIANIQRILDNTADYTSTVEQDATTRCDRLAGPTLIAGGAAALMLGPVSGVALLGCNLAEVNRATTPLSMLNYLDLTARQGILVKDGRSLEVLNGIDTVVFDKTGTLTLDQPKVGSIHGMNGLDQDDILVLAAAAGVRQTHPVARAVVTAAAERGLALPSLDNARYEVGYGVKVVLGQRVVHMGSARFMEKEGVHVPQHKRLEIIQEQADDLGNSLVFVAQDQSLVGAIELHSTLRPEVPAIVSWLQAREIELHILSGDTDEPTYQIARQLGIEQYRANVHPDDKARIIQKLRDKGRSICFVGDGINDAVALKTANVGISLSGSSHAALDNAGIILLDQNLSQLKALFTLAKEMEHDRERGYYATTIPGLIGAGGVLLFGMGLPAALILDMAGISAAVGAAMWPKIMPTWRSRYASTG